MGSLFVINLKLRPALLEIISFEKDGAFGEPDGLFWKPVNVTAINTNRINLFIVLVMYFHSLVSKLGNESRYLLISMQYIEIATIYKKH